MDEKEVLDTLSESVKDLLGRNNIHTYEGLIRYEDEIENILCNDNAPIIKPIFENAFQNEFRGIKNIHMPLIVFYLHSGITKSRICMPIFFLSVYNNEYKEYFENYKKHIKERTKEAKGVLDTEKKDHMLGVMLDEKFNTNNIPLVIRVYKNKALDKTIKKYIDIQYKENLVDNYKYSALEKLFKGYGIKDNPLNIELILRKPLEFLCDNKWAFPKSWKTVYYVYFPERILCSSSSGCTVVLVSTEEKDIDKILKAIDNFVDKTRTAITRNVTSIISRLELEAITKSISSKIEYPKYYAVQKPDNPFPQMPLLDRLKEMKEKEEVIYKDKDNNSQSLISHIVDVLDYLVYKDKKLTTGYTVISKQVYNAVIETYRHILRYKNKDIVFPVGEEDFLNQHKLLNALKTALEFEDDLAETPGYREHFIHCFHVFCTGVCIMDFLYENKIGMFSEKNPDKFKNVLIMFFFAAFWHDITYCVEKMEVLANRYLISIHAKTNEIPIEPHFGHLLKADEYVDLVSGSDNEYLKEALKFLIESGFNKIALKACRTQLIDRAQHGVLSAVVFMDLWKDSNLKLFDNNKKVGSILLAMMLHHCLDFDINGNDTPKVFRPWTENPWDEITLVPSLLLLCDCFAQYGRDFERAGLEEEPARIQIEDFQLNTNILLKLYYENKKKKK